MTGPHPQMMTSVVKYLNIVLLTNLDHAYGEGVVGGEVRQAHQQVTQLLQSSLENLNENSSSSNQQANCPKLS